MLPHASKAILPVIFSFDNGGKGQSWPSEITIAALSGLSRKIVRKAITELRAFPGFSYTWKMTQRGRQSKRFNFTLPSKEDNDIFFFHKIILSGGNWRMLKPISKAVYPVLRTFAAWDKEEAEEEEEIIGNDDEEIREDYSRREFEYSEAGPGMIGKHTGISRARVFDALKDLVNCFLIEHSGNRLRVYLTPPKYYKRDYLNEQLIASFKSELGSQDEG
jgi:hypothetical protein